MGYENESYFSQIINEKVETPKDFINKLKLIEPNLNEAWLESGNGTMLKSEPQYVECEEVAEIKDDIKEEESIPIVPEDVLSRRELDIFDFIQQNGSELENVDPRELVGEASFCLRVLKDSMAPDIMQGDVVFCQFLPKNAKLHSGGIYFIDTPLYAGVIRDVFINGNIMTLKARNPKYGDIVLDLTKDKYRAANLKGSFRNTFSSAFSQMQNVYKKKDEQIDKILEQQGKLIDHICREK